MQCVHAGYSRRRHLSHQKGEKPVRQCPASTQRVSGPRTVGPQPIDVQPATSAAAASSAHIPGLPPDVIIDTTSSRKASLTPAVTPHRLRAHGPGYVAAALSKQQAEASWAPTAQHNCRTALTRQNQLTRGSALELPGVLVFLLSTLQGFEGSPHPTPKSAPLLSSRVSDHGWRMWWGVPAALSSPQPRAPPQPPRACPKGWHPAPNSGLQGA